MADLLCSIAGCGAVAEAVYRGYSLCSECLDLAYAVEADGVAMEQAISACRDFDEDYPGQLGFAPGMVSPMRVVDACRRHGERYAEVLERQFGLTRVIGEASS